VTRELNFKRKGPVKGNSLVIFLHGYGADGADLLGLGDALAPHMPQTVFMAPDAPDRCTGNPMGYQWFPIPWLDGSEQSVADAAMASAANDLNAFLDVAMMAEELTPDRIVLFGFSQGAMMSLEVAPRRAAPFAGVAAFSGRLIRPEALGAEALSKPPVLLVHGDADEVVPFSSMNEAGQALNAAGFEVYAHVMQGTGHGIAPDGLSVALSFMADKLGIETPV